MIIVSLNKLNRLWKNGILPKLNEKVGNAKVLSNIEEIEANTDASNIAGALALKAVNNNLGGLKFGVDSDGNYGYIKAGADAVTPFKKEIYIPNLKAYSYAYNGGQGNCDIEFGDLEAYKTISIGDATISGTSSDTSSDAFKIYAYSSSGKETQLINGLSSFKGIHNIENYERIKITIHMTAGSIANRIVNINDIRIN